jgi:hypothetical protein
MMIHTNISSKAAPPATDDMMPTMSGTKGHLSHLALSLWK